MQNHQSSTRTHASQVRNAEGGSMGGLETREEPNDMLAQSCLLIARDLHGS